MRIPRPDRRRRGPVLAAALLALSAAHAAPSSAGKKEAFAEVARADFAAWDLNHDGRLQSDEVDLRLNDPALKGKEAAAIASIKTMQRKYLKAKKELFEPTLKDLESGSVELESTADEIAGGHAQTYSLGNGYAAALRRLPEVNRKLYAKEGPDFEAMGQGPVGDCFLFSCLGYLAKTSPERIKGLIETKPDGAYAVRFPAQTVPVAPMSDAKIILNNSGKSVGDGLWLPVLEQAMGTRFRETAKHEPKTKDETDAIASGGSVTRVIETISGRKAATINLRRTASRDGKPRDVAAEIRAAVPPALADRRIVTVTMPKTPREGSEKIPILGYNHAYAIVGYDAKTDTLTLWNPWGNTKEPKGEPGVKNGYPTKHGLFDIPLAVVAREFGAVAYEPPPPAHY